MQACNVYTRMHIHTHKHACVHICSICLYFWYQFCKAKLAYAHFDAVSSQILDWLLRSWPSQLIRVFLASSQPPPRKSWRAAQTAPGTHAPATRCTEDLSSGHFPGRGKRLGMWFSKSEKLRWIFTSDIRQWVGTALRVHVYLSDEKWGNLSTDQEKKRWDVDRLQLWGHIAEAFLEPDPGGTGTCVSAHGWT